VLKCHSDVGTMSPVGAAVIHSWAWRWVGRCTRLDGRS